MERVLFIGNGPNRLAEDDASWGGVLTALSPRALTQHEEEVRGLKPFVLWAQQLEEDSSETSVQKRIADHLKQSLRPREIHKEIMLLDWPCLMTTNYDDLLERSIGSGWESGNTAAETRYSLFRCQVLGSRQIWHVHGDVSSPQSIMINHQHYSGYMHKISDFLRSGVKTEAKRRRGKPYLSKFAGGSERYKGDTESWVDIFLEREVHMVGYGLDYHENHLWNLILLKHRLRKKNKRGIGQLFYHRCGDSPQTKDDEARISLIESFGGKVLDHSASTYEKSYKDCLDSLK